MVLTALGDDDDDVGDGAVSESERSIFILPPPSNVFLLFFECAVCVNRDGLLLLLLGRFGGAACNEKATKSRPSRLHGGTIDGWKPKPNDLSKSSDRKKFCDRNIRSVVFFMTTLEVIK
jgi:hypothetical protein